MEFLLDNPKFIKYHKESLIPDEMFFQMILLNNEIIDTIINDNKRFILWNKESSHPISLSSSRLPEINMSDKLFARKFEENAANPKKIEELTANFIADILTQTKGKISHWDVTNENYTNKDLQRITGSNKIIYDAFVKEAESWFKRFEGVEKKISDVQQRINNKNYAPYEKDQLQSQLLNPPSKRQDLDQLYSLYLSPCHISKLS